MVLRRRAVRAQRHRLRHQPGWPDWTKHGQNPIFTGDPNLAWEHNRVTACQVFSAQGWYLMFYIGFRDTTTPRSASRAPKTVSPNWQRHPANPIVRPGKDNGITTPATNPSPSSTVSSGSSGTTAATDGASRSASCFTTDKTLVSPPGRTPNSHLRLENFLAAQTSPRRTAQSQLSARVSLWSQRLIDWSRNFLAWLIDAYRFQKASYQVQIKRNRNFGHPAHQLRASRATFEPLEDRRLMSASALTPGQIFTLPSKDPIRVNIGTLTVTNTNDSGAGSLREAIVEANRDSHRLPTGIDIDFAIGAGPATIELQSQLPFVQRGVTIDATTQPGYSGTPLVALDGRNITNGVKQTVGFQVASRADVTVEGFSIDNFDIGIRLQSGTGVFSSNVIGANPASAQPSVTTGIQVLNGKGSVVEANTVVSPKEDGIDVNGGANNTIAGNTITNPGLDGISLFRSQNNSVGLEGYPSHGNTVTDAAAGVGIHLFRSSGNSIFNNTLGGSGIGDYFGVVMSTGSNNNRVVSNQILQSVFEAVLVGGEHNSVSDNTVTGTGTATLNGAPDEGIEVGNSDNAIIGNQVSFCGVAIEVTDGSGSTFSMNTLANNIHGGIEVDPGFNSDQPAPLLASATADATSVTFTGTVQNVSNAPVKIECFASPANEANEADVFLGDVTVQPNGGVATFSQTFNVSGYSGSEFTATATSTKTGSTSVLSNTLPVVPNFSYLLEKTV